MLTAARLGATALAGLLLAGSAAAPALAETPAPTPTPVTPPAALYGKGDPTYDGVWRQSLTLTALAASKVVPADSAVSWLTGQQCADGGWPSYRAAGTACDPKTEDSNATAVAVQALTALGGHQDSVARGVSWLKANRNADGTWSYNPGGAGDADSTGLATSALAAAKADPGKNARDGLAAFQLGCAAPAADRGAFAYQPGPDGGLAANGLATAQAALAAAGGALPVTTTDRADGSPAALGCPAGDTAGSAAKAVPPARSAEAASAYLVAQLAANGQHLMLTTPGAEPAPDLNATSWAVLSLVAAGHPHQAAPAADWLAGNSYTWAAKGPNGTDAAATATLLLVARAAKLDPYNFGGTNLVQLLVDAGPAVRKLPAAAASGASANPNGTEAPGSGITDGDDNGGFSPIWLAGTGLVVGIGGGLVISLNRRRQAAAAAQQPDAPADDEQP